MAITNFTWANGTQDSPISLTTEEIGVLIKAGKDESITTNVSGVYTTSSGTIRNYLYHVLQELYPNLVKHNGVTITDDDVQISLGGVEEMNEGTSIAITATGNVPLDYLKFRFTFTQDNGIDAAMQSTILSRMSVVVTDDGSGNLTGKIVAGPPEENTSWVAPLKITAFPSYIEDEDMPEVGSQNRADEQFRVKAVALAGVSINGSDSVYQGTQEYYTVSATNPATTKLTASTIYSFSITPNNTSVSPVPNSIAYGDYGNLTKMDDGSWRFNAARAGTSVFTLNVYLKAGEASVGTASLSVACSQGVLNNTITINQQSPVLNKVVTIDGTNPLTHYDNIAINSDGTVKDGTVNAIAWIRENSHLYVGQEVYNSLESTTIMYLRQLDDTDKTKWASNGNDATIDDPSYGDVWLKLPEFWYKVEPYRNGAGNIVEDAFNVSFAVANPSGLEGTWEHWDGLTLIGVYEGYVENNRLYSVSGKNPHARSACTAIKDGETAVSYTAVSASQSTYKNTYAKNRGSHFHIVSVEAHSIMALLGYAFYGNVDIQSVCGRGTPTHWVDGDNTLYFPRVTGLCDSYGMADTVKAVVDSWEDGLGNYDADGTRIPDNDGYANITDDMSVNFWGLENWWGNVNEFMDNLMTLDANRTLGVFPLGAYFLSGGAAQVSSSDSTPVLPLHTVSGSTAGGSCITKMSFLDDNDAYAGILPKTTIGDSNYASGYCDYGSVAAAASRVAARSSNSASLYGGLGCLSAHDGLSNAGAYIGSRLLYKADNASGIQIGTTLPSDM